jgi:hypothetical protein
MPLTDDRKKVIRLTGLAVSFAGLTLALRAFLGFVRAVAGNSIEGGAALLRLPEYYRQVGAYYSRGFITGFFACYCLMMVAIIVGTWVDEIRRTRRAARAAELPAIPRLAAESAIQK